MKKLRDGEWAKRRMGDAASAAAKRTQQGLSVLGSSYARTPTRRYADTPLRPFAVSPFRPFAVSPP